MYFEKAGKENTQKTLQIAKEEALKRGISHIVVASTFGDTALAAARDVERHRNKTGSGYA